MSFNMLPLSKVRIFQKRLKTTNTVKQSTPDLQIKNPFANNAILLRLKIIPDSTSRTDANIEIYSDDDDLLYSAYTGDLTDMLDVEVPLPIQGKILQNLKNVNVYFWNLGISSNLTILVSIGVQ